ncbi:cullin-2 [Diaphorina citri]|uniref:Cullin-2 n=2 Tax=Diaphorina citri TaxID=121845 RepID=A0A3Q0IKY0_DIACI|nr:cullin-2 [Diaphorina citri]
MSLKPKQVDFNKTWGSLQETIQGVITLGNVRRATWNDRFSDIYSLCVAYPEPLADRLYQETKLFLDQHVTNLRGKVLESGERNLVNSYYDAWTEYSQGINYMHQLYLYLNQQHIKKQKLSEAEIIYGNYTGDSQEQMEIGELVKLYVDIFETQFLEMSGEWYKSEASKLLQTCNVSQYMERVLQVLHEETNRSVRFLHVSSYPKVKAKCEQHMVADHLNFLQGECVPMVAEERRHDLANMYPLLRSVREGINILIDAVRDHICKQGLEAISGLSGDNISTQFVENMLAVHKKYKAFVKELFSGDQSFMGALDKACSSVINHKFDPKMPSKSPEYLAKYCDMLLKKSSKGLSESEMDDKLSQSITVFKYIDDKDVFHKFYAKMLAKRLIHQQSTSMDGEEAMINKLKQACGYEFTNKFHRMLTDIKISGGLNEKFHSEFVKTNEIDLGIHFSINILQAGSWPLGPTVISSFSVPQELEKCIHMFEKFYHGQFNGRKLSWLHNISQVELKLSYLKRPYFVTMQTFQMAILLLFEKNDAMTCGDIQTVLSLSQDQIGRHIASLVECKLLTSNKEVSLGLPGLFLFKYQDQIGRHIASLVECKLLTSNKEGDIQKKKSTGDIQTVLSLSQDQIGRHIASLVECKLLTSNKEELTEDTEIRLNLGYNNKRTKLKISGAVQKETPQEIERTVSSVDEDRKLYLQAAIVRIMKSRKQIRHNALIQEVLSQSKSFAPSISMIKKCIESLIDKNYVERTANSTDEYSYVA